MGLFFKTEHRSLSSRSESMMDLITNADGTVTINFDGETALEQSDVFTAIKILSGDIAASKFKFVDEKNTNPQKLDLLNAKPNSSMTPYTFMFATMAQMLLSGNSFAIIHDDWLEFAKPSQVVVYEDLDNGLMRYEYTNKAGTSYKVDSSEMLHFKYVTINGKTGISPLDALKTELSMLDNGNKMLSSFFKKGIQSGGVLKLNKGNINNTSRKQIKKDFEEVNSGASNANSVIVLDETQDFKQFEINTDILKMIQNNVYSTKQIAKAFGIPLSRFGMELVNTKDDAANDVYVSSTLRALARMITDELFIKLGIKVELDFSTLTGQDTASRMNKAMDGGNGGDGYLLVNEIRNYYGLADIPGGNIIYTKTTARGGVNNGNGNSEPSGSSIRENRTIEGYALKFNSLSKDLGGFKEIISPEALANTDLSDVRCFVDHDSSMVLGRTASQTLELTVDDVGLHFRCQLPNTTYANDLYESINRGDINECSFGFVVRDDSQTWTQQDGTYIRNLNSIDELFEISIVSIPAYDGTDAALAQRSLKRAINEQEKTKITDGIGTSKLLEVLFLYQKNEGGKSLDNEKLKTEAQKALDSGDLEKAKGLLAQIRANKEQEETQAQLKTELEDELKGLGASDEPKTEPETEEPTEPEQEKEPEEKEEVPPIPPKKDEKKKEEENRSMEVILDDKKTNETRSINQFIRTKGETREGLTTVGAEAVIPIDRITKPEKQPETVVDLRQHVGRVPVTTGAGSYPILKANKNKMISVDELATNPALANPEFTKVNYEIATYRGYIPVSQEALDDSDIDLGGLVAEHIQRQSLNTSNAAIAAKLQTATAVSVTGIDDLKDIVNVKIDPAYAIKFVASQSFFNELDKMKDNDGRYLLQQDVTVASGYKLLGREVVVMADDVIGTAAGDKVAFIGDPSLFAKYFDRQQASVRWVDNDVYGQLLAGFVRFDVEVADTAAGFYVTLGPKA